ncbi:MAG: helix-turn-helix transcriptional regulator, partial [Patescibacteria group bacterium]|nr:helix-turn-helix transcriptional regulator [Patescibacteria group bacterium]
MSAQKLVDFDQNAVGFFLRRAHPQKTAEHVAERIGCPPETVRQWLRGHARPNFSATLALVGVYGPELLAAALPRAPQWLARALSAERRLAAMEE